MSKKAKEEVMTDTATPDEVALAKVQEVLDAQAASATTADAVSADESVKPDKDGKTEKTDKGQSSKEETPEAVDKFPALTDKQVQAAKHLGYAEKEIAELTPEDAARLQKESARLHKVESKMGRQDQRLSDLLESVEKLTAALNNKGQVVIDGKPAVAGAVGDALAELKELSPDADYDEIVDSYNTLVRAVREERTSRIADKKALDEVQSERQEAVNKRVAKETDEFFEKLDAEVFDEYGAGPMAALDEDSEELDARRNLINKAKRIMGIHAEDGEDVSVAQCLDEALSIVSPEKFKKAVQKPLRDKIADRKKTGMAVPSSNATLPKVVDSEREARLKMMEYAHKQGQQMSEV